MPKNSRTKSESLVLMVRCWDEGDGYVDAARVTLTHEKCKAILALRDDLLALAEKYGRTSLVIEADDSSAEPFTWCDVVDDYDHNWSEIDEGGIFWPEWATWEGSEDHAHYIGIQMTIAANSDCVSWRLDSSEAKFQADSVPIDLIRAFVAAVDSGMTAEEFAAMATLFDDNGKLFNALTKGVCDGTTAP